MLVHSCISDLDNIKKLSADGATRKRRHAVTKLSRVVSMKLIIEDRNMLNYNSLKSERL